MTAFELMDLVPMGCGLFKIEDRRHLPHLKPDEYAVIDYTDREIVLGEVYLVRQSNGPILWQIRPAPRPENIQVVDGDTGPFYMLCPMNRPRSSSKADFDRWFHSNNVSMSDGPISLRYLTQMLLARVVGIFDQRPDIPLAVVAEKAVDDLPKWLRDDRAGGAP